MASLPDRSMPARTSSAVLWAPNPEPILCCAVLMTGTLRIGVLSKSSPHHRAHRARTRGSPDRTGESRSGRSGGGYGRRSPLGETLHRASAERSSLWAKGEARGHCPVRTHGLFNGQRPLGVPPFRAFAGELCHPLRPAGTV